jgi:hypothetical protein
MGLLAIERRCHHTCFPSCIDFRLYHPIAFIVGPMLDSCVWDFCGEAPESLVNAIHFKNGRLRKYLKQITSDIEISLKSH